MLPGRRKPPRPLPPNATPDEGGGFAMTIELPEAEAPRRQYTGNQVFPIVAALMFGMSVALWAPVIIFSNDDAPPEKLLFGSAILLAAFLAGELFPLLIMGENKAAATTGLLYLAVAVGVLAGALMSAVAVGLTYRLLGPAEPLARVIGRSMLSAAAIVTFALVGYTVWNAGDDDTYWGPAVCIALAGVLAVLYRTYFLFLRQHADLTRMYSFGRQVTSVGSSIDDWQGVLEQVRDQLNAEVGVLRLNDGDTDGSLRTLAIGPEGVLDEPKMLEDDPLLTLARTNGRARASTDRNPSPEVMSALADRKAWDVLVVPLRSGDRDRGYLEVRDRLSRWGRFRDEDLQLLETLSGHVATALD